MTDERDNDSDRLIHPETWPCDPAILVQVFHGWAIGGGMIELWATGSVYSAESGRVFVLQAVPHEHVVEAAQLARSYINAAARLAGTRS